MTDDLKIWFVLALTGCLSLFFVGITFKYPLIGTAWAFVSLVAANWFIWKTLKNKGS